MFIDGDWVTADGTTLGADNGIGVAAIMGLLASKDIPHPALEALFTIDEETGMTGAHHLEEGILDAEIMLNLEPKKTMNSISVVPGWYRIFSRKRKVPREEGYFRQDWPKA